MGCQAEARAVPPFEAEDRWVLARSAGRVDLRAGSFAYPVVGAVAPSLRALNNSLKMVRRQIP